MLMIGGERWSIVSAPRIPLCSDKGGECYGFTDFPHHIIWLHSGQSLKDERDSLVHELSHAALAAIGVSIDEQNRRKRQTIHDMIWRFAAAWTQLMSDNPALADYLTAPTS